MSGFVIAKIIHILSICMLIGATLCNGLLHLQAFRSADPDKMSVTLGNVMFINHFIMAPSFLLIPASGFLLASFASHPLTETWLWFSILLTIVLLLAFIIGYKIESRMEKLIIENGKSNQSHPSRQYYKSFKSAAPIGASAAVLSLIIIYLMVAKP